MFDLDEAPEDEDEEENDEFDMDDEFDIEDDDEMLEDEDEVDSAFASSNEGGEDEEMDEDDELPPPHMRPNPIPTDDEDGLMTNLEDDLENDGFTLPAVERGGEQEEHEHGTSLREVENRMRWLVKVCANKDGKVKGVPGKSRSDHLLQLEHDIATYFGYNTFLVGKLMKLFNTDEVGAEKVRLGGANIRPSRSSNLTSLLDLSQSVRTHCERGEEIWRRRS
jgi:ribosomal RNA methyltransferase Nop2